MFMNFFLKICMNFHKTFSKFSYNFLKIFIIFFSRRKPWMHQLRQKRMRWWCLTYPVRASCISNVQGRCDDHSTRDRWGASYTGQFDLTHTTERRRIEPSDHLCHFDNASHDEVSARVVRVANSSRRPAANAGPRHSLHVCC